MNKFDACTKYSCCTVSYLIALFDLSIDAKAIYILGEKKHIRIYKQYNSTPLDVKS